MTNKIFLVEDDATIVSVIQQHLTQWGLDCEIANDFQHVFEEYQAIQPDLVILDISLPYFNGFYWCQEIRKVSEVPIIFLSSAKDHMNQVMALNMGADEFIEKPFELTILLAKIQALLRRSYKYGQQLSYSFGEYQFVPAINQIQSTNDHLPLTPNESRILSVLFATRGQTVPREQIIETLWQSDDFIDNNTLAVNLTRLRKKLKDFGIDSLIQTVKNKGYLIEEK
ncbi:DNA-binding response regulator [Enterococcus avium]|jgi:DNA-binding response OmpR family regulator|uniref:DNA-binding response regulator n=1 Tax=Enterococcus avium TaxID=33945 RepID=A0A8B5VVR1_ENTAV|nr:response regulator transcription factor [Enterococcus avium]TRZ29153.1 DNA-binding response regulator [Enterococcus avium]